MKSPIRIINTKKFCVMVIIMAILLVFYLLAVIGHYQNVNRVHPDEIRIRDWIHSVHGSMESRLDPERHITIVYFRNSDIMDDDLIRLKQLSHLQRLELINGSSGKCVP